MPRSSGRKTSKHSSKNVKEFSESEKDSTSRDRKSREDVRARVSKDYSSNDKRKLDLNDIKEGYGTGNGEHVEEYGSSKRRREKGDAGTADRWNGGGDHDRGDNAVVLGDGEAGNKSAGKEGRRQESRPKEARLGGAESKNKGREERHERVVDNEDHRQPKQVIENTVSSAENMFLSSRSKSRIDGVIKKRRGGSGDASKKRDGTGDLNERSSKDNSGKDTRQKSEKQKDDKHKKKYLDDFKKEIKHRDSKPKDKRSTKNHISSLSDEKQLKDENGVDIQNRKGKTRDSDRDRDLDSIRDRDGEADRQPYRDRADERKHGRDSSRDHDYYQDRNREHDHDRSDIEGQSGKYKRSRERKGSPYDYDDYADAKATGVSAHRFDAEKKSNRIDRVDYDAKRAGSQAQSTHTDAFIPNNSHLESEDTKYRDSMQEQTSKASYSRDLSCSSGLIEKGSKNKSIEKLTKSNDGRFIEPFNERSSGSKALPLGLVDRSPSSAKDDRRHLSRTGVRRSLEIEETGRRNSSDTRELSAVEERGTLDLQLQKPLINGGSSMFGPSAFRSGVDCPSYTNSVEDNSRASSSGCSRWNNDLNTGHGNAWRGVSNWTAQMPNSFIPFQHGPPHGGFQSMLPQFPAPSLFVNPSGMPYHIADMETFSSPFRPLGWQNVIDASVPSNLDGWDGSNGVFRDEPLAYRGAEGDQNVFMKNGRGWESSAGWNAQNGVGKTDSASPSDKDDHRVHADGDTISGGPIDDASHRGHSPRGVLMKSTDSNSNAVTPLEESSAPLPRSMSEKSLSPQASSKNSYFLSHIYLSKIEVSPTLTHPQLYDQCMNLLISEGCLIDDDRTSNHELIKIGTRAEHGSSKIIQSPSLFPPIKDFVFEKAMELYKKQMMKEGDVVFKSETMDMKNPSSDHFAGEEDPVAAAEATDLKLENSHEYSRNLKETVGEVEDNGKLDLTSEEIEEMAVKEVVFEEEGYRNGPPSLADDKPKDKPSNDSDPMKGLYFGGEEIRGLAPIAGSNESGSEVISRIHDHSPESTH